MSEIEAAFAACRDGYSADRIVVDQILNQRFVEECRRRGLDAPIAELNRSLLGLRKRGRLTQYETIHRTTFADVGEYRFAAEIAARFLERKDSVSLDEILCDPELAAEFDDLAGRIAPGFEALKYRWAALNLRKSRKLQPELVSRVAAELVEVHSWPIRELSLELIPPGAGLYLIFNSRDVLYVGESDNLRLRLKKHLDHSDNKGLARWLWQAGTHDLHVEVQVLREGSAVRVRRALELELIRSRNPVFNISR